MIFAVVTFIAAWGSSHSNDLSTRPQLPVQLAGVAARAPSDECDPPEVVIGCNTATVTPDNDGDLIVSGDGKELFGSNKPFIIQDADGNYFAVTPFAKK